MYVTECVCSVCMHVCVSIYVNVYVYSVCVCESVCLIQVYICIYVYIYIYMYVCMYIYIYIYIYIYLAVVIPMSLDEGEGSVGVLFHKLLLVDLQRSMANLNNRYLYMQAPSQALGGAESWVMYAGHGCIVFAWRPVTHLPHKPQHSQQLHILLHLRLLS